MVGVVAGVVGLAAIAALVFFLKKRRERENTADIILGPNPLAFNPDMTDHNYAQPKLHNPADLPTLPPPVFGRSSSHLDVHTTNSDEPGRYSD